MPSPLILLATYIAVWAVICIAWWGFRAERFGISGPPYYLIYRTARLNKWIERISSFRPTAWRTIWNVGIVTAVGLMLLAFDFLGRNLTFLIIKPQQAGPIQPIIPIPGVGVSFETFPYLALALSVLLASHELSHGIASLADHIPLKSTGLIFAHVVMGGFVEPEEEKLNQARNISKLRVFAAGSYANAVLGVLFLFLLANFAATTAVFYTNGGVSINSISTTLPVYSSGLHVGDTVTSINSTRISDIADLRGYMGSVRPGAVILLGTQRGTFQVKTTPDPSNSNHALIGISLGDVYDAKVPSLSFIQPQTVGNAEFWLANVLISVAFINMLPMPPFDGSKFLEVILDTFRIKRTKEIRLTMYGASIALLALNLLISFLRYGFLRY